jgi:hypothetical protein
MNMIRSRATLLGVNVSATPNYYAARSVMQWVVGPKVST